MRVVEGDVAGEAAREHPRHLGDVGHPRGAQGGLRVVDDLVVPADLAGAGDQAGQRAEQARLAGAHLAQQQHQLAGVDLQVDVLDAERAVVVHGREVADA